jgi:hypothetical protein
MFGHEEAPIFPLHNLIKDIFQNLLLALGNRNFKVGESVNNLSSTSSLGLLLMGVITLLIAMSVQTLWKSP